MNMNASDRSGIIRFAQILEGIPGPQDERSTSVLQRGTLHVKLSARPLRPNRQTAHAQDEIYVIVQGRGVLFHDGKRDPFGPGDCLFVAAGTDHHFEDFSDDLAVWVIFYGAEGGEAPG
jgi:mannose-6-phosphate isomerase-like protein (cupin superfamily)